MRVVRVWFVLMLAVLGCLTPSALVAEEAAAKSVGAAKSADTKQNDDEYYELFRSFADTLDQVERNYVKEIDRRELMEAAIRGMLTKLDPYSSYIDPKEFDGFRRSVDNQFGGIGIQITMEGGQLKVLSPLVGTPAYRAGIQAGDRIVKIGDESTDTITQIDEAVKKLKGDAGSEVRLTVIHPGSTKLETVTIKREVIQIETVLGDRRGDDDHWDYMLDHDKNIGYVRLTAFSRDTAADLKKVLDKLKQQGMKGLILDLRFNPGGLLNSAIEISDLFVADGRIVSTEGRNTPSRSWEAVKPGTFEGFPMVVLVNRYSASASEIVAACLQDHKRAIVIGERSWGKGSVQNVIELEDGRSALKLTTASYQRPSGENIHRFPDAKESDHWGVKPNDGYEVKLTMRDLNRLVDYRRTRDILTKRLQSPEAGEQETVAAAEDKPAAESENAAGEPQAGKTDSAPADHKAAEEKPAGEPDQESAEADKGEKAVEAPQFVDTQLQKAVDYLNTELARAE